MSSAHAKGGGRVARTLQSPLGNRRARDLPARLAANLLCPGCRVSRVLSPISHLRSALVDFCQPKAVPTDRRDDCVGFVKQVDAR